MSFRILKSLVFAAAVVIAAVSCKEETETLPYLDGNLYFSCPSYVAPKQVVRMTPSGVKHPEGEKIGYYWKVSPSMTYNDTTDLFVYWFTDTLQTCTVTGYAFASGYYGSSYSKEVNVVQGGLDGSIKQTGIKSSDKKIIVDGVEYYYEKIGNLEWFRNNLASDKCGTPYLNEDITSDVFGRFYTYSEAVNACPEGWRLPTEEDWMALADAIGSPVTEKYSTFENVTAKLLVNATFNGNTILEYWPVVGDVNNESRLSFIPFGYSNLGNRNAEGQYPDASFEGMYEYLTVWTADAVADEEGMAYYRYLRSDLADMLVGKGDVNTFGASVRCVRDAE